MSRKASLKVCRLLISKKERTIKIRQSSREVKNVDDGLFKAVIALSLSWSWRWSGYAEFFGISFSFVPTKRTVVNYCMR